MNDKEMSYESTICNGVEGPVGLMGNPCIAGKSELENVDQTVLANNVSGKIKYEMLKEILVKPLPVIKLKRTHQIPVVKDTTKEDGLEVNNFEETTTEEFEIESSFREGVVLKLPVTGNTDLKIGDTIVYNGRFAVDFDLFKDSQLVKIYDVIAKIK